MRVIENLVDLKSLIDSGTRVVVVFSARDWCVPCRRLHPHVEAADERLPNVLFVEVDIDKSVNIRNAFDVLSVPTVLEFNGGNLVGPVKGRTLIQLQDELSA